MSAPAARRSAALAPRATPTTRPKPPRRPAATPASASSTTIARPGRTSQPAGGLEEAVGRRLAAQPELPDVPAVDGQLEQPVDAGGAQHGVAVRAGGDDGGAQAGGAQLLDPADRAVEGLHAAGGERPVHERLLVAADVADERLGRVDAARAQEVARPVLAGLAVDMGEVVVLGVEGLAEELLEGLLPARGVQRACRGEDAVEVEEGGGEGERGHARSVRQIGRGNIGRAPGPAP